MHEFEALLFSDTSAFIEIDDDSELVEKITNEISTFSSPEEVNNSVETAPSKRIQRVYNRYKKTVDGIMVLMLSRDIIKKICLHVMNLTSILSLKSI
jgi:uncharacterized membrane protein YheB (UPF0754 family)